MKDLFNSIVAGPRLLLNQMHPIDRGEGSAVRGRLGSNSWQWPVVTAFCTALTLGIAPGADIIVNYLGHAANGFGMAADGIASLSL